MSDGKKFNSHQERLEKYLVGVMYDILCTVIPQDAPELAEFRSLIDKFHLMTTERYQTLFENSHASMQAKIAIQVAERDVKLTSTDTKTKEEKVSQKFAQLLPQQYDFNSVPVDVICSDGFSFTITTALDEVEGTLIKLETFLKGEQGRKSQATTKKTKQLVV